jgi:predicted nuclease with TOPRIM domain
MAKQTEERRKDYSDILNALSDIKITLAETKKDTTNIFDRLDKMNGCVQDYIEKRHQWEDHKNDIDLLTTRVKVIEAQPKLCEDRFIGRKLFISISIILSALMAITTLINNFPFN